MRKTLRVMLVVVLVCFESMVKSLVVRQSIQKDNYLLQIKRIKSNTSYYSTSLTIAWYCLQYYVVEWMIIKDLAFTSNLHTMQNFKLNFTPNDYQIKQMLLKSQGVVTFKRYTGICWANGSFVYNHKSLNMDSFSWLNQNFLVFKPWK